MKGRQGSPHTTTTTTTTQNDAYYYNSNNSPLTDCTARFRSTTIYSNLSNSFRCQTRSTTKRHRNTKTTQHCYSYSFGSARLGLARRYSEFTEIRNAQGVTTTHVDLHTTTTTQRKAKQTKERKKKEKKEEELYLCM